MNYITTRSQDKTPVTSSQAILKGLGYDGGLYLPETIPVISPKEIEAMKEMTYQEKASYIFSKYLTDFTSEEIENCVHKAYNETTFNDKKVTPLHKLEDGSYVMELYHGPTCAFKDVALQILPHFLTTSARKNKDERTYVILVATSGDTGKAAMAGFKDVEGTKILVFYPADGVSKIQELQMVTQEGNNVGVLSVEGNFDDTQTGVKKLFSNPQLNEALANNNYTFSSANSINWGRLVPQIVYYFDSYLSLVNDGEIKMGDAINYCVPTGNFGNILAGYFAKEMGLPIKKLICAANENNVLTDFIKEGVYDRNRPFFKTISPSMDILISSNLERLLYLLLGKDCQKTAELMTALQETGRYEIPANALAVLRETFWSASTDDKHTKEAIHSVYTTYDYLIDTHTGVAYTIFEKYRQETGDTTPCVMLSTASPYKFNKSVGEAILKDPDLGDEIGLLKTIAEETKTTIPEGLNHLDEKEIRFQKTITKEAMYEAVEDFLKIK